MPSKQEIMQEIANRGLQDQLPPERRAIFDEALKRGLIQVQQEDPIFAGLPQETADQIRAKFPEAETTTRRTSNPELSGIAGTLDMGKQDTVNRERMRAANLERIRIENPMLAEEIESLSPAQQDLIGMGRFFNTTGAGIKRLLGLMDEQEVARLKDDTAQYDKLAGVKPRVGLGEGLAAAPVLMASGGVTSAIASTPLRVAAGAGLGAAETGLPSLGAGDDPMTVAKKAALGAGLNVAAGELFSIGKISPAKQKIKEIIETEPANKSVVQYYIDGAGKVQKDRIAKEAIRQGFDDGVIAVAKGASPTDKAKMLRMVKTVEAGKKNALYAANNRASDVVGDSLAKRVKFVQDANQKAAKQLDTVAQSLKGKPVDYGSAVDDFLDDLDSIGVKFDPKKGLNFKGSDIEGVTGAQNIIKRVVNRMKSTRPPDAYDVHRMKRFIDEQVTYGKNAEGLAGNSERIIKRLRASLDKSLDDTFPRYNQVNTQYSDTIQALDGYQKAVGKSIDFSSPNSEKALGTVSRRLLSNAQTRVNQLDMLNELEGVAKKYGANFDDDIMTQVLFADELDSVFGAAARTSLQGDVAKPIERAARASQQGALANTADLVVDATKKLRGVNEEKALEAIKGVLGK